VIRDSDEVPDTLREQSTRRVVLIEDDAATRSAYRGLLEASGCAVHEESDGAAGVRTARTIVPDVVVTDLILPVMDGCAVARELRGAPATRGIPIIAATGEAIVPQSADGELFDVVLHKPFAPHELVAAIDRVCDHPRSAPPLHVLPAADRKEMR
jgi:CheY-like chemotaxis protein